jgi:hypothetical protein
MCVFILDTSGGSRRHSEAVVIETITGHFICFAAAALGNKRVVSSSSAGKELGQ